MKKILLVLAAASLLSGTYAFAANGDLTVNGNATIGGNVGIGTTTPAAKLHVNGEIILGNSGTPCSASTQGALRFNASYIPGFFEFCNGTDWRPLQVASCLGGVDSYTKIMLHCSDFTDSSPNPKTFTTNHLSGDYNQSPSIFVSSEPPWGSVMQFTAGGWIATPDSADFTLGTGDFTIDFNMKRSSSGIGVGQFVLGQDRSTSQYPDATGTSFALWFSTNNLLHFDLYYPGGVVNLVSTTPISTNWIHVAIVRQNGLLKMYLGGTAQGAGVSANVSVIDSTGSFSIGRVGDNTNTSLAYYKGYIDEFRFSKGVARWTSNFTPPNLPYCQ